MRIYKVIISIMLVMALAFQGVCISVKADDDGAGDNVSPSFEPKVMVESYKFSKDTIYAGKDATVWITLVNTSNTSSVKNMMVTAGIENEYLQLTNTTDSIYIPQISAGGRCEILYRFKAAASTPSGQYDMSLTMDYADKDGGTYSAGGIVKINISQKTKVKFDPLIISSEAEIGDTIEAQVNAMNLGREKVYNVRAKIKADGLTPQGTIYIGDIEAGEMGTGNAQVLVGGLSESDEAYGVSNGTVTFYYENESGETSKLKEEFSINIKALSTVKEETEEDNTSQWWVIMAVIAGVICIFAVYGLVRIIKRKSGERDGMAA